MSIKAANLGFPSISGQREPKFAVETPWAGKPDRKALRSVAARLPHRAVLGSNQHSENA